MCLLRPGFPYALRGNGSKFSALTGPSSSSQRMHSVLYRLRERPRRSVLQPSRGASSRYSLGDSKDRLHRGQCQQSREEKDEKSPAFWRGKYSPSDVQRSGTRLGGS